MTKRLEIIFSALEKCKVFADVGCDHGYVAKAMLDGKRCERVIVSDVSARCLEKAQALLSGYIAAGLAESVVSDGFDKVGKCDQALIAGMGGEEICSIIENAPALPERLVLQPMKNVDKVRIRAVNSGYRILSDYCFTDGKKYYDLIVLVKGGDVLTADEIEFGRDNIVKRPSAFLERNKITLKKLDELLSSGKVSEQDKAQIQIKYDRLKEYV